MSFVKLLAPGMWAMRKMRFGTKLALLALIVLLPLVIIVGGQARQIYQSIEFTKSEIAGNKALDDLTDVMTCPQSPYQPKFQKSEVCKIN